VLRDPVQAANHIRVPTFTVFVQGRHGHQVCSGRDPEEISVLIAIAAQCDAGHVGSMTVLVSSISIAFFVGFILYGVVEGEDANLTVRVEDNASRFLAGPQPGIDDRDRHTPTLNPEIVKLVRTDQV